MTRRLGRDGSLNGRTGDGSTAASLIGVELFRVALPTIRSVRPDVPSCGLSRSDPEIGPRVSLETVIFPPSGARSRVSGCAATCSSSRWYEMGRTDGVCLARLGRWSAPTPSVVVRGRPRGIARSLMAATEVPFDTKLAAPLTRTGTVAKSDVIARLRAARVPFAAVVAPAGYGKTTLLARWAEADPRPFAWVALDGRDDDAVVFLRYIAAAIHRVEPLPPEVFDALSGPGRIRLGEARPASVARWPRSSEPLVLVLDDLHAVANPACLDVLAALARVRPGGIADRDREQGGAGAAARALADARLGARDRRSGPPAGRAGGRAAAGGGRRRAGSRRDRRADRADRGLAGRAVPGGAVDAGRGAELGERRGLHRRRPVRLRLLPPRAPLAAAEAEAQFLTHTSVLERMCGGLCDAVVETTGSARDARALERANGFVVPPRPARRVVSLPPPVRRTAAQRARARRARSVRRAQPPGDGLVHRPGPARGGDRVRRRLQARRTRVAGLVDALALPLYYDGRMETLEEWLGWFGDDELARYPALAVYGAWIRALTGRPAEAERWLALADGATSAIPLSDGSATIEPWVAILRAHMMRDGVEQRSRTPSWRWSSSPRGAPGCRPRCSPGRRACDARRDR